MATEEYHFYVALLAPRGLGPIAAGLDRDWHTTVYVSGHDGTNYLVNNHEDLKLEKGFWDGEDYIFSSFFRGSQETGFQAV